MSWYKCDYSGCDKDVKNKNNTITIETRDYDDHDYECYEFCCFDHLVGFINDESLENLLRDGHDEGEVTIEFKK